MNMTTDSRKPALSAPVIALLSLVAIASCGDSRPALDVDAWNAEILEWRDGRRERLLAPQGYLNQVGLFWLEPGNYGIGAADDNDIVLPGSAAGRVGEIRVVDDGVLFVAAEGVDVSHNGTPVTEIRIATDLEENPVLLEHGSVAWSAIDREGRIGIRVRDYEHPFATEFGQLPYYEIDPDWRVDAVFQPYPEPRTVSVSTVVEGLPYLPVSPGTVSFEVNGKAYELEVYDSGDDFFFVFGDLTNRGETYGAGRFLYSALPDADGHVVLDFNKAYSPPCAFNDFSTCPVASPRNRLNLRVTAGERYSPELHYSSGS